MKFPIFLFFLVVITKASFGQTTGQGCFISGSSVIYPHDSGNDEIWWIIIIPTGPYSVYDGAPISTLSTSCPRAVMTGNQGSYCIANGSRGRIWNYNYLIPPIGCPIDEYTSFLLLAGSGLGFLLLSRKQ